MTQFSPTIGANKSGLGYRQDDNDGKKALLNHHKGASAPSYAEAGMIWLDDSATPWLYKAHDGADWITLGEINAGANTFTPYVGSAAIRLLNYAADTGTASAYAVAPVPAISAYVTGLTLSLKPANASTGSATIAVSGLAAKNIKLADGSNPPPGFMAAGGIYTLVYNGTDFIITNTAMTVLLARGTALASAATTDIGAADSDFVEISGTTTITSLGSSSTRNHLWVKFQGSLTLTHNATSLILPGGASITTAAGDVAEFVRLSGGNWQCLSYTRASGHPVATLTYADMPTGTVIDRVYTQYGSLTTCASLPVDASIPQIGEGTEIMTAAITPKSTTNRLRVTAVVYMACTSKGSTGNDAAIALFKDATTNALSSVSASGGEIFTSGSYYGCQCLTLVYEYVPATTSATTLRIRAGNGTTNPFMSSAGFCTLVVEEIKA